MNHDTAQNAFFLIILGIFTFLAAVVISPFAQAVVWAGIFSILLYPSYKKIIKAIKNEALASAFTVLLAVLVVFVPTGILIAQIGNQAAEIYQQIETGALTEKIQTIENTFSVSISVEKITNLAKKFTEKIAVWGLETFKATTSFLVSFFVMLYVMFYMLKDGPKMLNWIKKVLPTNDEQEEYIFQRFYEIVHALFKGTLIIALIQSAIGAIVLLALGFGNVSIWFALMFVLSVIPALGPAMVLAAFAIYSFAIGNLIAGLVLIATMVVVSIIDNVLRPTLVGKGAKMHDLAVALSVFGGLSIWGLAGFVLGPIIIATTITLWEMYSQSLNQHK